MKLDTTNRYYLRNLLSSRGYNCPEYYLRYGLGPFVNTPQGHAYWYDKVTSFRNVCRRLQLEGKVPRYQILADAWEAVLTEEDWGFFKYLLRDKRYNMDKFLNKNARPAEDSY